MQLKDKIAIVTGAGEGMGKAIALRYAKEGAHVIVAEVNEVTGQQTANEVSAYGRRGLFVKTDMSKLTDINTMVLQTIETFGHIDILLNNAGVTKKLDFFQVTETEWDWMFSVNTKGLFFCMQAVAREMAQRKEGKIINIASAAGKGHAGASNIAYAGSKGAVIAMTRIGALQLAGYNINVNAICPGTTETEMLGKFRKQIVEREKITEEEVMARLCSSIPLRRSNTGDDIANMAAFLASEEARNITGQSINVDGGMMWD